MRESTPWKIATVILAITTLALVAQEAARTPAENGAPGPAAPQVRQEPTAEPPAGGEPNVSPGRSPTGDGRAEGHEEPDLPTEAEVRAWLTEWVGKAETNRPLRAYALTSANCAAWLETACSQGSTGRSRAQQNEPIPATVLPREAS